MKGLGFKTEIIPLNSVQATLSYRTRRRWKFYGLICPGVAIFSSQRNLRWPLSKRIPPA